MSAFVVNGKTMFKVARLLQSTPINFQSNTRIGVSQGLLKNLCSLEDELSELSEVLTSWLHANITAVRCRYRDNADVNPHYARFKITDLVPRLEKREEWFDCLKALQCLIYQCSEDVTDHVSAELRENHALSLEEMKSLETNIIHRLIETDPMYTAAPLGE